MATSTKKADWLDEVWMQVQAEIDAEELADRMDAEPEFEDTNVENSYGQ